jgi:hypothetical protein
MTAQMSDRDYGTGRIHAGDIKPSCEENAVSGADRKFHCSSFKKIDIGFISPACANRMVS